MPLRKLNTYHMRKRCLKRPLNIKCKSKVSNEVLKEVNLASCSRYSKRNECWLGHFVRMNDNQIRKEQLYGAERSQGNPPNR